MASRSRSAFGTTNDIVALFNSPMEWSPIVTSILVKYGPTRLELSMYGGNFFVYASPNCGVNFS